MKKFFYVAVMAIAVVFASCASGNGSSERYKNGKTPVIDNDKCTVNGIAYDNNTAKCWEVSMTITASAMGISSSETTKSYVWGTEFFLVCEEESIMAVEAALPFTKAKYSYVESPADDSEACYAKGDSAN